MTQTRSTPTTTWKVHLIDKSHQLSMNEKQIDGLQAGLDFGRTIELPQDMMLNVHNMCDMLFPQNSVQDFTCLRYKFFILFLIYISPNIHDLFADTSFKN